MIVVIAAMMKAGSSWYFSLANDFMVAAGHQDCQQLHRQYRVQRKFVRRPCLTRSLRPHKLALMSIPHWQGCSYALKTHGRLTLTARAMASLGILKACYIYRDPRDVAVSLYEHGEKIRSQRIRSSTGLDALTTMEAAIDVAHYLCRVWKSWIHSPHTLITRYEDLLADPKHEAVRLLDHLELRVPDDTIRQIVEHYDPQNRAAWKSTLHFNQAESGRWRRAMTAAQQETADAVLGGYIRLMGYPA
jgi:hypothetical protein